MSRAEFRAQTDAPRPPASWLMVGVAAGMLWVTEQIAVWAILTQTVALVVSLQSRSNPHAWQRNPFVLNAMMFGITGATIAIALQGHPSTVSLAHFTALTQGLQLLDARPRKSEFLLVTMALFQVILAANLTDSVLFPPLLAVFVVATTWTLLVHTLRMEALEAGDPSAAERALTPALVRTTVLSSTLSIVLALCFFVTLPRLRTSVLSSGLGQSRAMAGFSDQVELGTIGRIGRDPTIVLRVETLEGTPPRPRDAYWRGLAFDAFDGRSWSISQHAGRQRSYLPGAVRFGIDVAGGIRDATLVQRVTREPVEAGVVFGAGLVRRVEGPLLRLELDRNGGLYAPAQVEERVRYTVWTRGEEPSDAVLRDDRIALPALRGEPRMRDEGVVALPAFSPEVAALAREITQASATDAARARAIEVHLRAHGRYTDDPPALGGAADRTPIEDFLLGDLAGHCEYFASAMIVLARSIGLPARLVNGFAGGRENSLGGFVELARSDAHAWVEIHYEKNGWVRYDPTPPDLRMQATGALGFGGRMAELASAVELWWFQRVVDFDTSDQIGAVRGMFAAWRSFRSRSATRLDTTGELPEVPTAAARSLGDLVLLGLALALATALLRRRALRERAGLPAAYAAALRALSRRGLVRSPGQAAREFAREAGDALSPAGALAFSGLTEAYLAERFGGHAVAREAASAQLETLRRELREA